MNKITKKPYKFGKLIRETCDFKNCSYSYLEIRNLWDRKIQKLKKQSKGR